MASNTKDVTAQHSVCVFCASGNGVNPIFVETAKALGKTLANRSWRLVYGGAHVGLMGAVADAALAAGGEVIGVIPRALVQREIAHRGLTQLIEVGSMHERKAEMAERADAFVVLPGGLGTLDELCEILTWSLLGIHRKPVILVNTAGYWGTFLQLLSEAVTAGFLRPNHGELVLVAKDPEEACTLLVQAWH